MASTALVCGPNFASMQIYSVHVLFWGGYKIKLRLSSKKWLEQTRVPSFLENSAQHLQGSILFSSGKSFFVLLSLVSFFVQSGTQQFIAISQLLYAGNPSLTNRSFSLSHNQKINRKTFSGYSNL